MKLDRREFLTAVAGAGVACGAQGPEKTATVRKPNIVWIMLDDLGYADPGCYGQQQIRTPNIDRLAAEGMRFTDAYAGCTVCAPSRSVLMTGLHTGHTPVRINPGGVPLAEEDITVGDVLHGAGYRTGCFGKWGLGDARTTGVPWKHGFDEFFGYLHQVHAHTYYPEFLWDNDRRYELPGNRDGQHGQWSADLIAERSFDFIRRNRQQPFLLYAAYTLPHGHYEIPDEEPYTDRDWPAAEKKYAAMVTRADAHIGRLMSLLKEYKLEENTIVFFTSDNGGGSGGGHKTSFFHSNAPLRGEKRSMYEGGIRVPMIARWPGKIQPGATSPVPWAFQDFLPTAAELAGAGTPPNLDGVSVLPVLRGEARSLPREYLYWELSKWNFRERRVDPKGFEQALRAGEWKVVRPATGAPLELYNLAEDIGETRNLAGDKPDVAARLSKLMEGARTEMRPQAEPPHPDGQRYNA